MAEATVSIREERRFILDLDEDEAQLLYDISYYIFGGDPVTSRRRHLSSVEKALKSAGLRPSFGAGVGLRATDFDGNYILFKEQEVS